MIRPATPEDVDAVRRTAREAYARYVERIGREPAPMAVDYDALVSQGRVRVAAEDARVIGYAVLVPYPDHLLLENLAVVPAAQGCGVGAQLLLDAEAYAVALGLSEIRLFTNEAMTENLSYYARCGYVETRRATEDGYRRVFFAKPV